MSCDTPFNRPCHRSFLSDPPLWRDLTKTRPGRPIFGKVLPGRRSLPETSGSYTSGSYEEGNRPRVSRRHPALQAVTPRYIGRRTSSYESDRRCLGPRIPVSGNQTNIATSARLAVKLTMMSGFVATRKLLQYEHVIPSHSLSRPPMTFATRPPISRTA